MSRFVVVLSIVVMTTACEARPSDAELFGPVPPADYLTGRFDPYKHPSFVLLESMKIPVKGGGQILRREAAEALSKLLADLRAVHPDVEFWVQSSTRNWDSQKGIWDGKFSGKIEVEGRKLNKTHPDALARARKILEYSSMPGTSRHHWGTDFDMNMLYNSYYDSGKGRLLYEWMKTHAAKYGFCQPYTSGRTKGYQEERWHWSYRPLSSPFLARWKAQIGPEGRLTAGGLFLGSTVAGRLAEEYVSAINPACE